MAASYIDNPSSNEQPMISMNNGCLQNLVMLDEDCPQNSIMSDKGCPQNSIISSDEDIKSETQKLGKEDEFPVVPEMASSNATLVKCIRCSRIVIVQSIEMHNKICPKRSNNLNGGEIFQTQNGNHDFSESEKETSQKGEVKNKMLNRTIANDKWILTDKKEFLPGGQRNIGHMNVNQAKEEESNSSSIGPDGKPVNKHTNAVEKVEVKGNKMYPHSNQSDFEGCVPASEELCSSQYNSDFLDSSGNDFFLEEKETDDEIYDEDMMDTDKDMMDTDKDMMDTDKDMMDTDNDTMDTDKDTDEDIQIKSTDDEFQKNSSTDIQSSAGNTPEILPEIYDIQSFSGYDEAVTIPLPDDDERLNKYPKSDFLEQFNQESNFYLPFHERPSSVCSNLSKESIRSSSSTSNYKMPIQKLVKKSIGIQTSKRRRAEGLKIYRDFLPQSTKVKRWEIIASALSSNSNINIPKSSLKISSPSLPSKISTTANSFSMYDSKTENTVSEELDPFAGFKDALRRTVMQDRLFKRKTINLPSTQSNNCDPRIPNSDLVCDRLQPTLPTEEKETISNRVSKHSSLKPQSPKSLDSNPAESFHDPFSSPRPPDISQNSKESQNHRRITLNSVIVKNSSEENPT